MANAKGKNFTWGTVGDAANTTLATDLAGERNVGTSNQYMVGVDECEYTVVDLSVTTPVTITANPALLYGIRVEIILSNHPLPIKDGSTTVFTVPATAAALTQYNFPGIKFDTNLTITPNASATGTVVIFYRDQ